MFCPVCKSEYKEEITHCPECDVDLVSELPSEEEETNWVQVLRTTNQTLLSTFEGALTAAGIPHFIRGAEAASLLPLNAVVEVPEEHRDAASALLVETEQSGKV